MRLFRGLVFAISVAGLPCQSADLAKKLAAPVKGNQEIRRFDQIPYKPYPVADTGLVQNYPSANLEFARNRAGVWLDNTHILINTSKVERTLGNSPEHFDVVLHDTVARTRTVVVSDGVLEVSGDYHLHTSERYARIYGDDKTRFWVKFDGAGRTVRLADEFVVLAMRTDPEPMDAAWNREPECSGSPSAL